MAGASASAACCAFRPARAKFRDALAASVIPKVELAAASFMALLSKSASSALLPMVLLVNCMVLSTSANFCTPTVPAATSGAVTFIDSDFPTSVVFLPMFFSLSPHSLSCAEWVFS